MSRPGSPDFGIRRLVVALVALAALAILVAVAVGLLTGFGGDPASASGASSAPAPASASVADAGARTVIAQPGDTLWALAVEHHDGIDVRRYLEALIDENGGPTIAAGQRVSLP